MEKYSNCKGDNNLRTHTFYDDPAFTILYSERDKKIKILWKKKVSTTDPKYFEAKKKLRIAKRQSLQGSAYRQGMFQGNL